MPIRKAQLSDFQNLADLGRQSFYDAFHTHNSKEDMASYLQASFAPEKIKNDISAPDVTFLIMEQENEMIGYAKVKKDSCPEPVRSSNCMQLERIYLLGKFTGSGMGKELMDAAIDFAKSENCEKLWLAVWQKNDKAIRFYKKKGFVVTGTRKFYLGNEINDDYIMTLPLAL